MYKLHTVNVLVENPVLLSNATFRNVISVLEMHASVEEPVLLEFVLAVMDTRVFSVRSLGHVLAESLIQSSHVALLDSSTSVESAALVGNDLTLMENVALNLLMSAASVVVTVCLLTCKDPAALSLMQMEFAVRVALLMSVAYVMVPEILVRYN